jgi:hypothetical protein
MQHFRAERTTVLGRSLCTNFINPTMSLIVKYGRICLYLIVSHYLILFDIEVTCEILHILEQV